MVDADRARYRKALDFLDQLVNWEHKVGLTFTDDMMRLDLFREALSRIGDPHRRYPVVLVAGSKGKGSTAAILARVLSGHGYRTGLSTSPHLSSVRERIRVDGEIIPRGEFAAAVESLQEEFAYFDSPGESRTYFESITAAGLLHFARKEVDVAVLEVGLGGRLDATNATDPTVSIITPISRDHTHILGTTLEKIAVEKAGIMREGIPVVIGRQRPHIRSRLERLAAEAGATASLHGIDYRARKTGHDGGSFTFDYRDDEGRIAGIRLSLLGEHQIWNAAAALRAVSLLEVRRRADVVRSACASVEWPGRGELFDAGGNVTVLLDGAHNGDSARALARLVDAVRPGGGHLLLFGGSKGKEYPRIFRRLLPVASEVVLTESDHPRRLAAGELRERIRGAGPAVPVTCLPDWREAFALARARVRPGRLLIVTGSLYLVGAVRESLCGLLANRAAG